MNKCNFGCATIQPDGWINVDKEDFGQTINADVLEGLPFPDDHFDYIVANHTIQAISYHDLLPALTELRRVLKAGGKLRVIVPDAVGAFEALEADNRDWFPVNRDDEPTTAGAFTAYITWFGTNPTLFSWDFAFTLCRRAGFKLFSRVDYKVTSGKDTGIIELDDRKDESIFFEVTK